MCFDSDAPEVEVSQSEITAAREAVAKYNERIDDGYVGLEEQAIEQAKNSDHSGYLKGIGSADLAQAEAALYKGASPTRRALDFNKVGNATATGNAQMTVEANDNSQKLKDSQMLGVTKTGQDQANNAAGGLMQSAANGLSSSFDDLQAEYTRQNARNQAIGSVVNTGLAAGAYKYAQQSPVQPKGSAYGIDLKRTKNFGGPR